MRTAKLPALRAAKLPLTRQLKCSCCEQLNGFSTISTPQRPTTPTKIAFGFLRKNTLSFPHSFRVIGEIFPQQKCGAKCRKMGEFSVFPQNPHPLLLLLLTLYINHNHSCVRLQTIRRTPHVGNFSRKTEPKNYERMTRTK